ncbi:MAG: hypothetical protein JSW04_15770 [Desulfobacterales bacterium]|nr:MAG: hypothetical protein JSW04_15770 [Desulfobacterales bacterium]
MKKVDLFIIVALTTVFLFNGVGQTQQYETQANRLESFLFNYCQIYESKDAEKLANFFSSDATENNKPFKELQPKYRSNMKKFKSVNYRIDLEAYSINTDTGNVRIKGKYFIRILLPGEPWKENRGPISMELIESGDSYLIKRLSYGE